jgi:hypothetical protein
MDLSARRRQHIFLASRLRASAVKKQDDDDDDEEYDNEDDFSALWLYPNNPEIQ